MTFVPVNFSPIYRVKSPTEMRNHNPKAKFVICGHKRDLRKENLGENYEKEENLVSSREGCQMTERVGAHSYVECSALTSIVKFHHFFPTSYQIEKIHGKGVIETFMECFTIGLHEAGLLQKKKYKCLLQ